MKAMILFLLTLAPRTGFANTSALSVIESYTVNVSEISGLCWRTNPTNKKRELVLVADKSHKLYFIDWESRAKGIAPREFDVGTVSAQVKKKNSEWESVYSDETGRIFILIENPSRILVISADLSQVEAEIELNVPKKIAKEMNWDKELNSKGEGFLLLSNGHLLIVKEKNPLRIIEFAPKGSQPKGYQTEFSIETKGVFPFLQSPKLSLEALNVWKLDSHVEAMMRDTSGINVGPTGKLYLLSDESHQIAQLGNSVVVGKDPLVTKFWSLPSRLIQPEGMVVDEQHRPIIALDNKKTKKHNLFVLSKMK